MLLRVQPAIMRARRRSEPFGRASLLRKSPRQEHPIARDNRLFDVMGGAPRLQALNRKSRAHEPNRAVERLTFILPGRRRTVNDSRGPHSEAALIEVHSPRVTPPPL